VKALILTKIVSLEETDTPLEVVKLPTPEPKPREIRIKIVACGVCHTELDEIEGRVVPVRSKYSDDRI
jgi:propanol-preferring alcohol dehydrogenase